MSPRRYKMDARRTAIQGTRKRILAAAARLHAQRGVTATSWDDIATEAAVSRATVYHHFPTLDDLIPACAQLAFDMIEVPTAEVARTQFAALKSPRARLGHFVRETCRCYGTGADWLRAAWRERDLVPQMGAAVERLQAALDVMVPALLEGVEVDKESLDVVRVLVDFPFYDELMRAGVPADRISARILALAEREIGLRR